MTKLITPEQLAKTGTEDGHQMAFMQWCALNARTIANLGLMHHVPNGGAREPSVAARMKALGVKRGVPDLFWPVSLGSYHGLYIELKKPGMEKRANGGRTDEQVEWHKKLRVMGYAVVTAYGWEAAVWALEMYRIGKLIMPAGDDCFFTDMNIDYTRFVVNR